MSFMVSARLSPSVTMTYAATTVLDRGARRSVHQTLPCLPRVNRTFSKCASRFRRDAGDVDD